MGAAQPAAATSATSATAHVETCNSSQSLSKSNPHGTWVDSWVLGTHAGIQVLLTSGLRTAPWHVRHTNEAVTKPLAFVAAQMDQNLCVRTR